MVPDTLMVPRRTRIALHLLAGGLLALAAALADVILAQPHRWGPLQLLVLLAGLGLIAIGLFQQRPGFLSRTSTGLCVSLLGLFLLLGAGEGLVRALRIDCSGERRAWLRIPPFHRQPTVPTGAVFFRRPGPERWTGQVLNTRLKQLGVRPNPYAGEPAITVTYDGHGFRNPESLSDWQIAVAGDSFTELGYLPDEQLFTTLLGARLRVPVLNLGASYTGPLTQLSYLEDYGIARSTRHAVIVFFEGNDLEDLVAEGRALDRWRQTGERGFREFRKQPSLVRFLYESAARVGRGRSDGGERDVVSGWFRSVTQGEVPVTLRYTPPGRADLSAETGSRLQDFLGRYAKFAGSRGVTPWLAYMPCKRRVLHGLVKFSAVAPARLRDWQPTDLPEFVAGLCGRYGIEFIDLTPALLRETGPNRPLLFNPVLDTHLNAAGSAVVAEELARRMSERVTGVAGH